MLNIFLSHPVKFVIPWTEMTRLERVSTGLMTEAIRVSTRQRQREFSMFLNLDEAFGVIGQLADIALRRLLDSEGLELDRVLQQPARITKRSVLDLGSGEPRGRLPVFLFQLSKYQSNVLRKECR